MATATVISLTPIKAVVKVWGTAGSATITLATTLKLANETAGTCIVDITGITAKCQSTGNTIVRNSNTLWNLGIEPVNWRFEGWCDTADHTSDIVVTLGTNGGTIVLELSKKGGYGDSQHNPLL